MNLRIARAAIVFLIALPNCHAEGADPQLIRWQCEQRFDASYSAECSIENRVALQAAVAPEGIASRRLPTRPEHYAPIAMRPVEYILAQPVWRVPVYGIPPDPSDVEVLLHAVLCGKAAQCSVQYRRGLHTASRKTPHPFIR